MTHIQAIEALDIVYGFIASPSESGGWSIVFPDLPGCTSWALTWEEIEPQAREASALYLESLAEDGLLAPAPTFTHEHTPSRLDVVADPAGPTLTSSEVARELGISQRRVNAIARKRQIGRRLGNYIVYRPEDVEELRPGKPGRPRHAAPSN